MRHNAIQHLPIGNDDGNSLIRTSSLEGNDLPNSSFIEGIGTQTVKGLGGKDDDFTTFKRIDGAGK